MQPPKVKCTTKIWHPNISEDGAVCLSILRSGAIDETGWNPARSLKDVVFGINSLFNVSRNELIPNCIFTILIAMLLFAFCNNLLCKIFPLIFSGSCQLSRCTQQSSCGYVCKRSRQIQSQS